MRLRVRTTGAALAALAALGQAPTVFAAPNGGDAGAPAPPAADAGASAAAASSEPTTCIESIPKGAERPVLKETFPTAAPSGWAATLAITVVHGKGERVLPFGLDLSAEAEAKKRLRSAGFVVPAQSGSAAANLWTEANETAGKDGKDRTTTHLEVPLLLLPEGPGRHHLELPPLPIAVARANGEIATVCTKPHAILVDDPIADVPDAKPRENPPPRPQREEWTALKKAVIWGGLGVLVGSLLGYLGYRWVTRPKPPPPPPPPRPPWEVALEKLDEVRHAGLLESMRYSEYFDRVSDAVRGYLGARFGFDGLESTTDEILAALRTQGLGFVRIEPENAAPPAGPTPGIPLGEIARFLGECDLVKFANLTPSPDQCASALAVGERIVRATMPASRQPSTPPLPLDPKDGSTAKRTSGSPPPPQRGGDA